MREYLKEHHAAEYFKATEMRNSDGLYPRDLRPPEVKQKLIDMQTQKEQERLRKEAEHKANQQRKRAEAKAVAAAAAKAALRAAYGEEAKGEN